MNGWRWWNSQYLLYCWTKRLNSSPGDSPMVRVFTNRFGASFLCGPFSSACYYTGQSKQQTLNRRFFLHLHILLEFFSPPLSFSTYQFWCFTKHSKYAHSSRWLNEYECEISLTKKKRTWIRSWNFLSMIRYLCTMCSAYIAFFF